MKVIGITGGSGFVGNHLAALLTGKGYEVIIFTRSAAANPAKNNVSYAHWDASKNECGLSALQKIDAIVNLAGAGIADKRWTEKRKKEILQSRVHAPNCKTFIGASATGFYGPDREGAIPFTEIAPAGNDFLGDVCRQWEAASQVANDFARTVILRFGVVLGKDGGAFPKLAAPLSFGIMPILGSGRQVMSWIAIDDLARLILFALETQKLSGIYNAVAPVPVTQKELMSTIATIKGGVKIPLPAPAFLLEIMLGEMSEELLKSCTASAAKTLATGFVFDCPDITKAVSSLLH
jgi:uncharacterized protein (TIGR01777 family)